MLAHIKNLFRISSLISDNFHLFTIDSLQVIISFR